MSEHLHKLIAFIEELEKLKKVHRQNQTLDSKRFENSAEHSWHVALMAVLMKDYFPNKTDLIKVVKMLLIHDVVEIDTGDTFLYDEKRISVALEEKKAAQRLFGLLPSPQKEECLNLWTEFEERITPEAQCAAAMDGLQPLINHVITRDDRDNSLGITKSQIIAKKQFIEDVSPKLWEIAKGLINKGVAKGLYEDS